eukprot:15238287-Alexandrium_andersonii.AAC.1
MPLNDLRRASNAQQLLRNAALDTARKCLEPFRALAGALWQFRAILINSRFRKTCLNMLEIARKR